ncbi:hypothetical protein JG687_00005442 [Phytophthora cactorum]|uniref:RXLR phytopathogen effector protein WY-domain domain-containing protein n=1 Tax=Phytophthora cactorum TaxID=29920 RepID=A0A8T1UQJ6_9STRA|nr:hypothetical protein JG687_00005442 [Phytophthora cactorum]
MRTHCAVIPVFIVFFASAAIVRASMDFESTNSATKGRLPEISRHSLIQGKRAAASTRVLKLRGPADMHTVDAIDEHEERGMLSNIVALASKASPSATNKLLLSVNKRPDKMFNLLGLGKGLDSTSKLRQWLRYTEKYKAKHGGGGFTDSWVISLLLEKTTDIDLALLIPSIKNVADLKTFGAKLESSLYQKWISIGTQPAKIKELLDQKRVSQVNENIATTYAKAYVRHLSDTLTGEALTKLRSLSPNHAVGMLMIQKVLW